MIVVDTNLLVYLLLPTPYTAQAEAIMDVDSDWIAPGLIHSELRNVFLGAVRRKDIALDDTHNCCIVRLN
jgi:predicted nucleic acid-binding protein